MHNLKSFFRFFYVPFFEFWRRFRYFVLPNLFSKTKVVLSSNAEFQQLTLITGRGKIEIGRNCAFGAFLGGFNKYGSIEFQAREKNAKILIGDNVRTNNNIFICSSNSIFIGANTFIGQSVVIMDFEAHCIDPTKRNVIGEIGNVIIGENVWIGNNVTILKNSIIGDNSIVAAGAVVSGTFDSNSIIGGIPAKHLKKI